MAILRVDSFDHYVTADMPKRGITTGNAIISAGNGRNGTASLRLVNATHEVLLSVPGNSGATITIGFAFRISAALSFNHNFAHVNEGAAELLSLNVMTTGAVRVQRGSTVLATSVTTPVTIATWHYIELTALIAAASGTFDVRVDGVSVVSGTGLNTRNGGSTGIWNGVLLGAGTVQGVNFDFDDLYVANDATFRGDHRVIAIVASAGNGTHTAWTPSTGSDHGALVDEAAPNTSDYVSSGTVAQIDTFNFAAIGVAGTIAAMQVSHYAKADVAGARSLGNVSRIGGVDYASAGVELAADWEYRTFLSLVSPATSVAWTVAEIDAAEFGPKVTA